jgi:hypothetical protein
MLQTNPADFLARAFDPGASPFDQAGLARGAFGPGANPPAGALVPAGIDDGVATPWFQPRIPVDPPLPGGNWGNGAGNWGNSSGTGDAANQQGGAIFSLISSLIGTVQQLVSSMLGGGSAGAGQPPGAGQWPGARQNGGPHQYFSDADLSSTGDPHLALTGTRGGPGGAAGRVDEHFDSMTSHRDLFDSADIAGGYRVSTTVSQPDANGVTTNRSATVHAGFGGDTITMRGDGSFSIVDDGSSIALAKGRSATLSGGETVSANQDGSLLVSAGTAGGGTIATTLRAVDGHVDVTAYAHGIDLGGDIVNHGGAKPTRH